MKKLCLILLMHLFLYAYPQVEICNLNQIYTTTDTLYPFRYSDYCSAVYVDGSCKVLSEDGFVRIILIDNNEEEWLIYERNNLFSFSLRVDSIFIISKQHHTSTAVSFLPPFLPFSFTSFSISPNPHHTIFL